MSRPLKPDPARGETLLERLATTDPARLDVASDAQLEGMLDAERVVVGEPRHARESGAGRERGANDRADGRRTPSSIPPSHERRSRPPPKSNPPTLWIAGGMLVAGAAALLITQGSGLVARFKTVPDVMGAAPANVTAPLPQAKALREQAFAACDARRWSECGTLLEQARQLDPASEADPRVVEARKALGRQAGAPTSP